MTGHELHISTSRPEEAESILRELFLHSEKKSQAALLGIRYLKSRMKSFGKEKSLDLLASFVVQQANQVASALVRVRPVPFHELSFVSGCKTVIDAYAAKRSSYGKEYHEDRCSCLLCLSEIHFALKRYSDSIRCLRECEQTVLSGSIAATSNNASRSLSLPIVLSQLARSLAANKECMAAAAKARVAIQIFQFNRSELTDTEWSAFAESLYIYCSCCAKEGNLDEVRTTLTVSKETLSRCPDHELIRPYLDGVRKQAILAEKSSSSRRRSGSVGTVHFNRRMSLGCESARVVIEAPSSYDTGVQAGNDERRSESLPPTRQYIQSSYIQPEDSEWVVCQSDTCGKPYYYSRITGKSYWKKPHDKYFHLIAVFLPCS